MLRPAPMAFVVATALSCAAPARASTAALSPMWIAEPNKVNAVFGQAVAGAGDVNGDGYADVIVGAPLYALTGGRLGRVYVYHGSPGGLPDMPSLILEASSSDQGFGYAVARAGDVNGDGFSDVIIGTKPRFGGTGEALVYYGSEVGLGSIAPTVLVQGGVAGISFGSVVAGAGDVNGDGYDDVLVGRPQRNPGFSEAATFVYLGSANGLATTPIWAGPGAVAVGSAGDFNGDGFDDILLGTNGNNEYGRATLYLGSASGPGAGTWAYVATQKNSNLGASVAGAGDVNGDGFDDIIVGENLWSNGQSGEGRALVFLGSAAASDNAPDWAVESNGLAAQLGSSVAGAGDVNGDGYADVIVGANQYSNRGRAQIFPGTAHGVDLQALWTADGDQDGALFGISVAGAGDVEGIGRTAVIVGANQYHHPEDLEGRAYAFQPSVVGVTGPVDPERLSLAAAPNPSAGDVELRYAMPVSGRVRLTIHDIAGRSVAVLADRIEEAGPHAARWNGRGIRGRLPSGVYVARLEIAGRIATRMIALTR